MSDQVNKIATPRGEARSVTSLAPSAVTVAYGDFNTGSGWFGPSAPMPPVASPEVAGREFDYPAGFNLATQPRAYEPVSFPMLRALADAYDPVRLIIERRKDQMCRLPWTIRVKHGGSGKRPNTGQLSAQIRGIIADVEDFFKHPSSGLNFRAWLRAIIEDILVIDAPSLYCERDHAGNLVGLDPCDGATIKVILDERGRQPRAFRWEGAPFDWLGQRVDGTNYHTVGFRIVDGLLYPPAFQQILHGMPAVDLTTWDLIYRPLNRRTHSPYGFSCVEQILQTVAIATRRANSQLEYFTAGNQPDAIFGLPPTWTPDNISRFQDYWDSLFSGNLSNRRRMKFVVGDGNSYQQLKEPPLKSEFDEWLVRIVCLAFSYPVSALVREENRATADKHEKQAEEEGIGPLQNWVTDTLNEVIEREFSDEIEFCFSEEPEVDQKAQAEILSTLVAGGILSVNEARQRLGEEPAAEPGANQLMVKTQTGFVPIGAHESDDDANEHDDQPVADDAAAQKLRKAAAITMKAPPTLKLRAKFKLGGTTYLPNVATRELLVFSEDDAIALEALGWQRK